jgi:hypothetical protein
MWEVTSLLVLSATIAVMARPLRGRSAAGQARNGMLALIAGLLLPVSHRVRPDPIETLPVAVAVAIASRRWGAAGLGVCIGLAVNRKVHAVLFPVVIDLGAEACRS